MGVVREILLLPVAPLRGTLWVAERILETAEGEFYNPGVIRRELEQVDALRQSGEITEDEAEEWEETLIDRLIESRHRPGAREG